MADKYVEAVREDLLARSERGLAKYGVSLERSDLTQRGWMQHLYEELLDAALYVKRLMDSGDVDEGDLRMKLIRERARAELAERKLAGFIDALRKAGV